jgi:hypothetical protein
MKAKDLTQADVGKWVTLRCEITEIDLGADYCVKLKLVNGVVDWHAHNTILEFTTPPPAVQEVGDVFKNIGDNPVEWIISMIDGNACLLRYLTGHVSADYPLNPALWEFVRKGTVA